MPWSHWTILVASAVAAYSSTVEQNVKVIAAVVVAQWAIGLLKGGNNAAR